MHDAVVALIIAIGVVLIFLSPSESYFPSERDACVAYCRANNSERASETCIRMQCDYVPSLYVNPDAPVYDTNNRCNSRCDGVLVREDDCKKCLSEKC